MRKIFSTLVLTAVSTSIFAADYSDNIHKNDSAFLNFNLMYSIGEKPESNTGSNRHDYLEMEFGGRSGIFDLYGYIDMYNLLSNDDPDDTDKATGEKDKLFMRFAPRLSIDAMTGKDLSFWRVQELYVATLFEWDGGRDTTYGVNTQKIGLGSDIDVPWFEQVGWNLYATYDSNKKDWNGYQISTDWFKPFYTFDNGTFLSYEGYIDYQFGMKSKYTTSNHGGIWFNGLYWHSQHYAVGYALALNYNFYGIKDSHELETTGAAHYFDVSYRF